MKRRSMSKSHSRKSFRKNTGIKNMNSINPRKLRGGIRL